MTFMKALAQDWLPPTVVRCVRSMRSSSISFEGHFATWEEAEARCGGYHSKEILTKVLAATLAVKRGEAAFERDSVLFDKVEHTWPVLAGLMWVAACNGGRLNVLDFGGALGSSYFQTRAFWQTLPEVRWSVLEQAHYVEAGRTHIQDERLRFYYSIEECLSENRPNAVLLSGVLQYVPDPEKVIDDLKRIKSSTIILDRTIVNQSETHHIYTQHVPPAIYAATYPCRSLSEPTLMASFEPGYKLVADFQSLDFPALHSIDSSFKGFVFQRIE